MLSFAIMKAKHRSGEQHATANQCPSLRVLRRFRWMTNVIEYAFTLLVLVGLVIRHLWNHTVTPFMVRLHVPLFRRRPQVSYQNDTVLITGGQLVQLC